VATSRLDKLRARRLDPLLKIEGSREVYERLISEDSSVRYAIGAMQPIDPVYTQKTIDERNRVEKQLADAFRTARRLVTFDYQGSLTNDTHIRAYSDVDLLTVGELSYSIEPPNRPIPAYAGDPVGDLKQIRSDTIRILRSAFPKATLDQSKGKCVCISGASLQRKIDLVASEWWHTVEYVTKPEKHWMGVQVLDNDHSTRIKNKPFLHNKLIHERDTETRGGLRKAIRLFKSLKYDSDTKIDLSSYDVASIAYNIFPSWLTVAPGQDLVLVSKARDYVWYLLTNEEYRVSIDVPNGMRKVFVTGGATEAGLKQLFSGLDALLNEINSELSRTSRKLQETKIAY
jgi:hypothetical protein